MAKITVKNTDVVVISMNVKSFHINQEILKEYESYARLMFQSFQNNQAEKK